MICTPPFSDWPLHVKIFRPEALEQWDKAAGQVPNMPKGFMFSIELEGVDGNSGLRGSGRGRSIDVQDGKNLFCEYSNAKDSLSQ
jgi:structure-specific endonuclease subunit SLX1